MKRLAVVLTVANLVGFFIPGLQEFFRKTLPVPLGAIPLALILLWLFWIARGEGKQEAERQDDLAVRIRVSDPRCLEHQTPRIQTPRTIRGLSSFRRITFWRCAGCGREIRLSGIQPEAVAA